MHEHHHSYCDDEDDVHSPKHLGFWSVQFTYRPTVNAMAFKGVPLEKTIKIFQSRFENDLRWVLTANNLLIMQIENAMVLAAGMASNDIHTYDISFVLSKELMIAHVL